MCLFYRFCSLLLLTGNTFFLLAQTPAESVLLALDQIQQLESAGEYVQAQEKSLALRTFIKRTQAYFPPEAIPLLNGIYSQLDDQDNAIQFLEEATGSTRRNPKAAFQVKVFPAIIAAYQHWDQPKQAMVCMQFLIQAKDSLAATAIQSHTQHAQTEMDSLHNAFSVQASSRSESILLNQTFYKWAISGLVFLCFLLIMYYRKVISRLRKQLSKKTLENDFLRSDRYTESLAQPQDLPPPSIPEPESGQVVPPPVMTSTQTPEKTALIIESNRQIVLYLKSLLSDRFEVETADTPAEGMQLASNHLPDLIVCAGSLNGQSCIDMIRQIKMAEKTDHIPIILLTERSGQAGQLDALRAGADARFNRPVLDQVFEAQINTLMKERQEKQRAFERALNLYFTDNKIDLGDPFLTKTVSLIDTHLNDPDLYSDDLARKLNLHKQHFAKKLEALTGKAPNQLIRELRLEKAKSLLEKRAAPPQVVADLVGFASSGSFALAFKDYFGENTLLLQMPNRTA